MDMGSRMVPWGQEISKSIPREQNCPYSSWSIRGDISQSWVSVMNLLGHSFPLSVFRCAMMGHEQQFEKRKKKGKNFGPFFGT